MKMTSEWTIKSPGNCRFDAVSLGEVMLRLDLLVAVVAGHLLAAPQGLLGFDCQFIHGDHRLLPISSADNRARYKKTNCAQRRGESITLTKLLL